MRAQTNTQQNFPVPTGIFFEESAWQKRINRVY